MERGTSIDDKIIAMPEPDGADLQDRVITKMVKLESALKGPFQSLKV